MEDEDEDIDEEAPTPAMGNITVTKKSTKKTVVIRARSILLRAKAARTPPAAMADRPEIVNPE